MSVCERDRQDNRKKNLQRERKNETRRRERREEVEHETKGGCRGLGGRVLRTKGEEKAEPPDANIVERLSSCKAVLESFTNGLDHTPLGKWTQQRLQDRTDGMYRATELARQLNVKRQNILFVPSGTLFELETMPPDQQLILKGMLDASPTIYGHVMAQMISNPSLPIHTPDLPSLDANTRLLVTQGHYLSFNECVPGHTKTGGDCNRGLTSVLRKHNMKVESQYQGFLDANPAGHVYADMHTDGDTGRAVR